MKYRGLEIEPSRDKDFPKFSTDTLKERYFVPGESSPQHALARASVAFGSSTEHSQRLYDYASRRWFMYATPLLSNGGTTRGLPISCFLSFVNDSRFGISNHWDENMWLATNGGGIGGYWGELRSDGTETSSGGASTGSIPFMKVVDSQMLACSQGRTRRGSYAAYQDISHPEIEEFITIRKPTGGDSNRKCLNLHHGVNVTDEFMHIIERCMKDPEADDSWPLIDPASKEVVKVVSAKALWQALLETRVQTGEPYLHFIDTTNAHLPKEQKALGLSVKQSNLCSEITLPTNSERTAVCCLSSVNLEKYDEWKNDPNFISDLVEMLDNTLDSFIRLAKGEGERRFAPEAASVGLRKAAYSAERERSIGLGTMGFHAYLQKSNIPFESAIAEGVNRQIFSHIKDKALEASNRLAKERGEPEDIKGSGRRNAHLLAIAPNASSSIICNTSPSIEPYRANYYTHKTLNGSYGVRNPYLEQLLIKLGKNTEDVWSSIIANGGSVANLDFLTEYEKSVFVTSLEIDQRWVVHHAAVRQEWICQAQSVNLFFSADTSIKYLHKIHFDAWKKGLKTLYYCRSQAKHRVENITTRVERIKLDEDEDECLSCQG